MLRPYQEEAIKANLDTLSQDQSPLTIMATGTGKTIVLAETLKGLMEQDKRTLIIAHRGLLLDQIANSVLNWTGVPASREQGNEFARWDRPIILATPQTLKGQRLARKPQNIDAIVIDECHRAVTPSMMKIYEHFGEPLKIGYTATADRPDGINLSAVFDKIAFQYSLARGVKEGYLSKIIGRRVTNMEIDISALRVKMGDFSDGDLGDLLENYLVPIAHNVIKETQDRKKVLLFLPNVDSSEHLASVLSGMGEAADVVSGRRKDNGPVFAKFKSGEIKYLCSCQLVVEGYDEPAIDTIVMLRPTLSRIVYSQIIGRGTRIAPGKTDCRLLEFTFNSNKHKLVTAYELMGDGMSERVVESAERKDTGDDIDFLDALEDAKVHQYDIREILSRSLPDDYSFQTFNPLDVGDIVGAHLDDESEVWFQGRKLQGGVTQKQLQILQRYMIEPEGLDKAKASKLINGIFSLQPRPVFGFASTMQYEKLRNLFPGTAFPPNMTKAAADMLIRKGVQNARPDYL